MSDTDEINGKTVPADPAPTMANVTQFASSFISPVMAAAINGCLKSLAHLNLEFLLVLICMCLGRCMGQVLSVGDPIMIAGLRKKCIDAFTGEFKKVPIAPLPPQGPGGLAADQQDLINKIKQHS